MMQEIFLYTLTGAGTGIATSIIGYLGNVNRESFDAFKFFAAVLVGTLSGGIAGAIANGYQTAIIGAMTGDVLKRATLNYMQGK